jgi:hypothetical protein
MLDNDSIDRRNPKKKKKSSKTVICRTSRSDAARIRRRYALPAPAGIAVLVGLLEGIAVRVAVASAVSLARMTGRSMDEPPTAKA